MLIDKIKQDNIQAMKNRDTIKKGIYSIIITKYNNLDIENKAKGRETSEAEVINIIQKTIKELDDELAGYVLLGRQDKITEVKYQKDTIAEYLPKQLDETEIKAIINEQHLTTMPDIMKYFKLNYSGRVDMSLVSKIARQN